MYSSVSFKNNTLALIFPCITFDSRLIVPFNFSKKHLFFLLHVKENDHPEVAEFLLASYFYAVAGKTINLKSKPTSIFLKSQGRHMHDVFKI